MCGWFVGAIALAAVQPREAGGEACLEKKNEAALMTQGKSGSGLCAVLRVRTCVACGVSDHPASPPARPSRQASKQK